MGDDDSAAQPTSANHMIHFTYTITFIIYTDQDCVKDSWRFRPCTFTGVVERFLLGCFGAPGQRFGSLLEARGGEVAWVGMLK